ncbi:MAG: hypothetical protein ACRCYY_00815 [Trueperaceae bacterium]
MKRPVMKFLLNLLNYSSSLRTLARGFPNHALARRYSSREAISLIFAILIFLTACCPPGASSNLQDTAFKATFLGFSDDQQYLLAQPEGLDANVQMVYDKAVTLATGRSIYVVGRLEGGIIYVTDMRAL